jgi:two-component system CheB/CheR fusion protein
MPTQPLRVLIVDDNRDTVRILDLLVKAQGHEVSVAYSGQEALQIAYNWLPDVVLLDIAMPGMDGFQVAKQMREQQGCKETCLVAITGYGDQVYFLKSKQAGFDFYFVKPVDPDIITMLLSNLARRKC